VTLDSAHKLLRTLTSNPKLFGTVDTARLLEEVLEDIGFSGLWRSSTFHAANDQDKQCITLTDRLIEVRSPPPHMSFLTWVDAAHHCLRSLSFGLILANPARL
jgi:hypothetical protein